MKKEIKSMKKEIKSMIVKQVLLGDNRKMGKQKKNK